MTSEGSAITFLVNFELVSSSFLFIAFVWYKCNERAGEDDTSTAKSMMKKTSTDSTAIGESVYQ